MPVTVVGSDEMVAGYGAFLTRLQGAVRSGDRAAVIRFVRLPLTVRFGGERRSYRTAADIQRDYDRIFSAKVRAAILGLGVYDLQSRDKGKSMGAGGLWFGPSCTGRTCPDDSPIRLREIEQ